MHNQEIYNKRIENIVQLVEMTNRNLDKIKELLRNLDKDEQRDKYRDVEGIMGIYDGVYLVPKEGEKIEVPANYSAKSRLVFGDTLKLIDEDGKKVFKQIEKVDRKKVEGILTKKEGKWHIISDSGTFKISDVAADFQYAQINDEAVAFIPANNVNVPYAALDKVIKKYVKATETTNVVQINAANVKTPATKAPATKVSIPASATNAKAPTGEKPKRTAAKPPYKKPATVVSAPVAARKEFVADIVKKPAVGSNVVSIPEPAKLDEDDLR